MDIERGLRRLNHDDSPEQRLLNSIDANNSDLIDGSHARAAIRAFAIGLAPQTENSGWSNEALEDPTSSAAVEARKYAAVIIMNQTTGLNIVPQLNNLSPGVRFPSAEFLMDKYPYIADCITNIKPFLTQAIAIANFN